MKGSLLLVIAVSAAASTAAGCKAKKELVDRPETLDLLKKCQDNAEESKKLITSYEAEIRRLEQSATAAGETVVTIEGEALKVRPAAPGAQQTLDPKIAAAQSRSFLDIVQKSRGPIQKCYEQALKRDTNLQARTVTLNVSASFSAAGSFSAHPLRRPSATPSTPACARWRRSGRCPQPRRP